MIDKVLISIMVVLILIMSYFTRIASKELTGVRSDLRKIKLRFGIK